MGRNNSKNSTLTSVYRWEVTARTLLASVGAFALVSAFGAFCAVLFAELGVMPLEQGIHVLTLFGFVAWCGIAMWAFYHRRLGELAMALLISTLAFSGLFLLLR